MVLGHSLSPLESPFQKLFSFHHQVNKWWSKLPISKILLGSQMFLPRKYKKHFIYFMCQQCYAHSKNQFQVSRYTKCNTNKVWVKKYIVNTRTWQGSIILLQFVSVNQWEEKVFPHIVSYRNKFWSTYYRHGYLHEHCSYQIKPLYISLVPSWLTGRNLNYARLSKMLQTWKVFK